jgi:hypothetical protein
LGFYLVELARDVAAKDAEMIQTLTKIAALMTLAAGMLLSASAARAADAEQKPNIVFILADDLGWQYIVHGPVGLGFVLHNNECPSLSRNTDSKSIGIPLDLFVGHCALK